MNNKFQIKTMIDLCAGTGAFSYVCRMNDIECVYANDIASESKIIYDVNHENELHLCNIYDIKLDEIPKHDLLCAGFPCQPFSLTGNKKGFEDPRSNVFWQIINILKYHKTPFVILENVKNIISHNDGRTYEIIETALKQIGYKISCYLLNTADITELPQHRERLYIICCLLADINIDFSFDIVESNKPIISYLNMDDKVENKYYYKPNCKIYDKLKSIEHINTSKIYQYRRFYLRENKSHLCPTLTANMGTGGHNVPIIRDDYGIRKLTPIECFRLQGFSDFYIPDLSDVKLYKLAGNAVSIPVVDLIIKKLKQTIS